MFGPRGRTCHRMVTMLALTVLTGCGAAGTAALGSASSFSNNSVPTLVSATTAAATVALTGTTGDGTAAIASALSAAQSVVAARSTGAQSVTSTVILSTAAPATAPTTTRNAVAAASTGGNVTQGLTFSGDLSGSFTSTAKPDLCGKKDQTFGDTTIHHTFGAGLIQGMINNQRHGLAFTITDYHGPDTYTGKGGALVSLANLDTQDVLIGDGSVVVAPGETSGTIESDVDSEPPAKAAKVHISGIWSCR
jgi:hypothetical protein